MYGYDYLERLGSCDECGAAWYVTGKLQGCSSQYCDLYVSVRAHNEAERLAYEAARNIASKDHRKVG